MLSGFLWQRGYLSWEGPLHPQGGSKGEESGDKTAFLANGCMLTDVTVQPVKRCLLAGFDRVNVIQEPKQLWDLILLVHF